MIKLVTNVKTIMLDKRGEGYLDKLMWALIIIVVGAAILTLLKDQLPNVWQNWIDKMSSLLVV